MESKAEKRIFGMLGFAMRAGKVAVGTEQALHAVRQGKIRLVLVSDGASEATKRTISKKCEFYKVDMITVDMGTDELGRLLGKSFAPAAVGIADDGFAREIRLAHDMLRAERLERKDVSQEGDR